MRNEWWQVSLEGTTRGVSADSSLSTFQTMVANSKCRFYRRDGQFQPKAAAVFPIGCKFVSLCGSGGSAWFGTSFSFSSSN